LVQLTGVGQIHNRHQYLTPQRSENHRPGYDYGEYQPSFGPGTSDFNQLVSGIGEFDVQQPHFYGHFGYDTATEPRWDGKTWGDRGAATVADTGRGLVDAEAQQLSLGHAHHSPNTIDIAGQYYYVNSLMYDGPWTPINLRIHNSIRTSDHNQGALPTIGPFGPPGPGAEHSFKCSLESETEVSVESETQVIGSFAESQPNDAFSSTLPTSRGAPIHEPEGPSGKQAEADLRDSETVYSLESAPGDERYISVFAHRLLCDLRRTKDNQDLSDLSPNFIVQTLKSFARRLYEESTNPFQWGTSVVLHKRRE
jgi:hypothetical protein